MTHDRLRVGWIGTGIMGGAICGRLLDAGFPLTVTSRSRSRAAPLEAKGASWVATPAAVAAASWSLANLAPRVIKGDFAPGFLVEHFLKDLGIALAECRRMGLVLPGVALAEQLYRSAEELGHGRSGTQALVLAIAKLSGLDWPVSAAQPKGST